MNSDTLPLPEVTELPDERRPADSVAMIARQTYREIQSIERSLNIRINGVEQATKTFKEDLVRVPTELDKRLLDVKELIDIKFNNLRNEVLSANESINKIVIDIYKYIDQIFDQEKSLLALEVNKINETIKRIEAVRELQYDSITLQLKDRDTLSKEIQQSNLVAYNLALQAQKDLTAQSNDSLILSINKSEESTQKQLEQQRLVLATVEHTLSEKIGEVGDRLTRFESVNAGRSTISGPIGVMIGAIMTGLIVASLLAFSGGGNKYEDGLSSRLTNIENRMLNSKGL